MALWTSWVHDHAVRRMLGQDDYGPDTSADKSLVRMRPALHLQTLVDASASVQGRQTER